MARPARTVAKSGARGRRSRGSRTSTAAMVWPIISRSRLRRTVSTSGSSGTSRSLAEETERRDTDREEKQSCQDKPDVTDVGLRHRRYSTRWPSRPASSQVSFFALFWHPRAGEKKKAPCRLSLPGKRSIHFSGRSELSIDNCSGGGKAAALNLRDDRRFGKLSMYGRLQRRISPG